MTDNNLNIYSYRYLFLEMLESFSNFLTEGEFLKGEKDKNYMLASVQLTKKTSKKLDSWFLTYVDNFDNFNYFYNVSKKTDNWFLSFFQIKYKNLNDFCNS